MQKATFAEFLEKGMSTSEFISTSVEKYTNNCGTPEIAVCTNICGTEEYLFKFSSRTPLNGHFYTSPRLTIGAIPKLFL